MMRREVIPLVDEVKEAGFFEVMWDGCDRYGVKVGSGVYVLRMIAENYMKVKKVLMVQ